MLCFHYTFEPCKASPHAFIMCRDPKALQLLLKLFIERSHSLWKEPEVLTWLEENARQVVTRVDAKDPLVAESSAK